MFVCVCLGGLRGSQSDISIVINECRGDRPFQGGGRGRKFVGPYKEKESSDTSIDNKSEIQ